MAFALFCAFPPSANAYEVAKRFGKDVIVGAHYRIAFADDALQERHRTLLEAIAQDVGKLPCGPILEVVPAQFADILIEKGELPATFAAQTKRQLKGRRLRGAKITLNAEFSFIERFPALTEGTSLGRTLRHEIGHALGLEHSRKKDALMHAGTLKNASKESFAFDDLMAFCHLYQD